jgi:hypothetical protein
MRINPVILYLTGKDFLCCPSDTCFLIFRPEILSIPEMAANTYFIRVKRLKHIPVFISVIDNFGNPGCTTPSSTR